ncbi:MAG: DIP1984 family protein [Bacteroidales bacterium]|nr:DIP1984 family protein [Lachnoclostridium sp.]MCM1382971.1 DIP1984 family protein [Lachnoclostridium sp.]MCM1463976.1 DIP1984 family protein [Bacteroidales bacterium]
MKLAAALAERADLQRKLSEIGTRLNNNAKVQEGEEPSEAPEELMKELDGMIIRLEELISRINITNSRTVHDGKTITELLAHRDCLKSKIQMMRNFLDNASNKVSRMTHSEIKIKSTVPVAEIQKKVDALSKELRQCDELIQELNWTTELM